MEKRKWLWKRKSFNSSPGGSDSSDSASSPSEKDSYKQLAKLEARSTEMNAMILSLEEEVAKERARSEENAIKCNNLEEELVRKVEELLLLQSDTLSRKIKMKQEYVDEAAGKLAECQKTIVSLRKQVESLATLEDFLVDMTSIPECPARGAMVARANGELWKLHSNQTFIPKRDLQLGLALLCQKSCMTMGSLSVSSLSSTLTAAPAPASEAIAERNRNSFAKFFLWTKNGIQLEI